MGRHEQESHVGTSWHSSGRLIICGYRSAVAVLLHKPAEIRVLEFPDDTSLGVLSAVEDVNCFTCGNGETLVGQAKGRVRVALPDRHWFVSLNVTGDSIHRLEALQSLRPNSISAISLAQTRVADDDLVHISHLKLRHIDLSATPITGKGLVHIKSRADWLSVSLKGAHNLNPNLFEVFRGQNKLRINLWRSNLDNQSYIRGLRSQLCDEVAPATCYVQVHGSQ